MNFYDAFRGFFGFSGRPRPRDPLFGGSAWDEEEEEEEGDDGHGPFMAQPPQDFTFGFGFNPAWSRGAFEELFRDMSDLLGAFGGAWAGPPAASRWGWEGTVPTRVDLDLPEPPGLTPSPFLLPRPPPRPLPPEGSAGRALRDSMLKHPESPKTPGPDPRDPARPWRPFLRLEDPSPAPPALKEDQDLDSQVSSVGLGTILRPQEPKPHSYFQSVSVTKVTLPDGAVEERRTVQDSHGRRETTVTRRRGDQTFITSTKEDGQGKDHHEGASWRISPERGCCRRSSGFPT
ncbi:HCLS1-associated protein X-1 isoform X2 [Heliangelus exortis]|uniref:HCLS1-associated protein X-1 isoform X2 n=1 Tax=Heliangelus exortis TaxID=472823 RepID=UPI003A90C6FA